MWTTLMASQTTAHLFAILQGKQEVRLLPLHQSLQTQISALFESQESAFRSEDAEELDFDPSLRPDEDQIIRIPAFVLPDAIRSALENPLGVTPLSFSPETADRIVGLFVGGLAPNLKVLLQTFNRRQMLTASGLSIILRGDTFRRLDEPGLVLDSRLSAVVDGGDLFLRSYTQAARVLDLTEYYQEATDEEITEFAGSERLYCEDLDGMKAAADTWVRRKVAILAKSGVMAQLSPKKAKTIAAEFKISIGIKRVGGKDRIVLPQDRQALKELLRFLDEDYYKSALSDARYVSHSKRKLAAAGS